MDLKLLWKQRRTGFWNGILPYVGYVIQSGVAMVFLFLVIAFSAWYTSFVQNIPAGFPIRWIALLLLAPLVLLSSYRTYLLPADIVFLRPQEYRMQEYLKNSFVRGVIYKMLGLLLVFLTLWPLYVRADADAKPLGWSMLFLVLWKVLSSYGAWQELRMVQAGASRAYRLLRWALAILAVAAWLWQPPFRSLWFLLLLAAVYIVALRLPVKHRVAWERLIQVEQTQAGRVMRTLGWFVDVPSSGQKVSSRRWLSKWKRSSMECRAGLSVPHDQNIHSNRSIYDCASSDPARHAVVLVDSGQLLWSRRVSVLPAACRYSARGAAPQSQ